MLGATWVALDESSEPNRLSDKVDGPRLRCLTIRRALCGKPPPSDPKRQSHCSSHFPKCWRWHCQAPRVSPCSRLGRFSVPPSLPCDWRWLSPPKNLRAACSPVPPSRQRAPSLELRRHRACRRSQPCTCPSCATEPPWNRRTFLSPWCRRRRALPACSQ